MSIAKQTVSDLLVAIAERQPTPGGGAVSAITLALGAALAEMVVNYSQGKKSLAEHAETHERARAEVQNMRARALELADADARVYEALNAVLRRKDDPPSAAERERVVRDAIDVPMEVLRLAARLAELADSLVGTTNRYLDSDLAMAAILAEAAAQSASWNIRINLPALVDDADRAAAATEMDALLQRASQAARRVQDKLRSNAK